MGIVEDLVEIWPNEVCDTHKLFSMQLGPGATSLACARLIVPFSLFSASSVIFILRYKQAVLMNMLTFFIFLPNTWDFMTSTLLPCWWRSIVLTCCCRVVIMARSCSSLVGGGYWREVGAGDVFPCCCCCCWDILYDDGSGDGDGNGDDSYSELVGNTSSSRMTT